MCADKTIFYQIGNMPEYLYDYLAGYEPVSNCGARQEGLPAFLSACY
ncbi:MAG: hypothetical protein GQF41_4417 [Candidatus Rifleibacterium amylolyticum]|nr:MAG: hypothetical protein GQF41_4417 [Candidatus Rifleibacterium amylolyticum]